MTLGGLALAVGILVDDATVAIENINWHLEQGKDARAGDPRRRRADRRSGVRLDHLHLHRVRADVLPDRRRALPVRADGRGGGVRDAGVLRAVADAGADDGEVPAEGAHAARARRAAVAQPAGRGIQRAHRRRLRAAARRLPGALAALRRPPRRCSPSVFLLACVASLRAAAVGRRGLLPVGRQRPVQAARARADRHAHRGDGGAVRPRRAR